MSTTTLAALLLTVLASLGPSPAATSSARASSAGGGARVASAATVPRGTWGWPLAGSPAVVRRFDPPAQRWLSGHRGVDLAAAPGTAVLAPAGGTVAFAGVIGGKPTMAIAHAGGLRSTYEPVTATLTVGTVVARGSPIGTVAASGSHCTGCLHWGVKRGETYLDPLALLGLAPPVLLPLDP